MDNNDKSIFLNPDTQFLLRNLPSELLRQPRFFALVGNKKEDLPQEWSNPDKQQFFCDIPQDKLVGFDTCGHGRAADYLFLDFDHVLDDNGNFVSPDAEKWFNYLATIETYCERSISGHGLHFLLKPTPNKFPMLSAGTRGTLYFDTARESSSPKLEIFYASKARYCFFTGDVFQCEPNAEIASGEVADEVFQHLIDEIKKNLPPEPVKKTKTTAQIFSDSPNYDAFRAGLMLDFIPLRDLHSTDWLAAISALKNLGFTYEEVDRLNKGGETYNEPENRKRWDSLDDPSFDISTLHGIAKRFGYQEKDAQREWYQLRPEFKPSNQRANNIEPCLKKELDDAIIFLNTLTPDDFTSDDAYNQDNIRAVAIAHHFGFTKQADNFFNAISHIKSYARNRIKNAQSGLTYPLKDKEKNSLLAISNINVKTIRDAIKKQAKEIADIQKAFAQNQQMEQEIEKAKIREEKNKQRIENETARLITLQEQYRKNPTKELADQMRNIIASICVWRRDKIGNKIDIKAIAKNAKLIFTYDPTLDGLIGFDEFRQADVFLKSPPWRKNVKKSDEFKNRDDSELRMYLRDTYTDFTDQKNLIGDCIISYSNKHSFHEVKDYLNSLPKWDGVPRAATLFIDFLRVDDTPFAREVTLNWLTAAVCRIFYPGCRYQTVLVLHGNQHIGKSFILEFLGGKWYSAISDSVDDPHILDSIKLVWIGEFKEMAAMRKAEINAIKSFVERNEDNHRSPYARRAEKTKRHCVFAITVNDDHFLSDMTGNRRFLVLHSNSPKFKYVEGLTDEYNKQVWAEVIHHCKELFKDGFDERKLELSEETKFKGEEIAQQYLRDDGMTGEIKAFLDTKILPPVIWNLLSREERRNFFANGGCLAMVNALTEFNHRRRARGGKLDAVQQDVNLICDFLEGIAGKNYVRTERITRNGNYVDEYHIYGSELREHICAAEINAECFGADKRKSMNRIHEILATLDGWELGNRLQKKDTAYGDQKKIYYRNKL